MLVVSNESVVVVVPFTSLFTLVSILIVVVATSVTDPIILKLVAGSVFTSWGFNRVSAFDIPQITADATRMTERVKKISDFKDLF